MPNSHIEHCEETTIIIIIDSVAKEQLYLILLRMQQTVLMQL